VRLLPFRSAPPRPTVVTRAPRPARLVVVAFAIAIALGTLVLLLPIATEDRTSIGFADALFTATSAVCVTGLTVADTASTWSTFGEVSIIVLVQIGGFGIMTLSALIALMLSRRLGIRQRLVTQAEGTRVDLGDVKRVVLSVATVSALFEVATAFVLTWRFWSTGDEGLGRAAYLGVFHAVSAFNNAGFALFENGLVAFVSDWWIVGAVGVSVTAGALGFPVMVELRRELRQPSTWSLHTKLTLLTTAVLVVAGMVLFLMCEWTNDATLGPLSTGDKLLAGWFQGIVPRSAGFNTLDYGAMNHSTWLVTDALMLIGGGSASTAGGIKVTTFALLALVLWAEVRGEPDVNAFGRRIPTAAQRQAISIVLLAIGAVVIGTFLLLTLEERLDGSVALFETLSAFSTAGLSTGATPALPTSAHMVLVVLMFLGRIGPITLFAALVLRERTRLYRYAHERPIIG
jgi:potassium uptake TrkH family protein